jgi:hypothetical protein
VKSIVPICAAAALTLCLNACDAPGPYASGYAGYPGYYGYPYYGGYWAGGVYYPQPVFLRDRDHDRHDHHWHGSPGGGPSRMPVPHHLRPHD